MGVFAHDSISNVQIITAIKKEGRPIVVISSDNWTKSKQREKAQHSLVSSTDLSHHTRSFSRGRSKQ